MATSNRMYTARMKGSKTTETSIGTESSKCKYLNSEQYGHKHFFLNNVHLQKHQDVCHQKRHTEAYCSKHCCNRGSVGAFECTATNKQSKQEDPRKYCNKYRCHQFFKETYRRREIVSVIEKQTPDVYNWIHCKKFSSRAAMFWWSKL